MPRSIFVKNLKILPELTSNRSPTPNKSKNKVFLHRKIKCWESSETSFDEVSSLCRLCLMGKRLLKGRTKPFRCDKRRLLYGTKSGCEKLIKPSDLPRRKKKKCDLTWRKSMFRNDLKGRCFNSDVQGF